MEKDFITEQTQFQRETVITVSKLPGQGLMLQFVVSVLLPAQGVPSVSGAGLSQVLSRVLVPP